MSIFEWIISGGILSLVGMVLKNNIDNDKKINRVYERLDTTKSYQEAHFTRNEVCQILHKQIDAKLTEICTDVKILLHNGNKSGDPK